MAYDAYGWLGASLAFAKPHETFEMGWKSMIVLVSYPVLQLDPPLLFCGEWKETNYNTSSRLQIYLKRHKETPKGPLQRIESLSKPRYHHRPSHVSFATRQYLSSSTLTC